MTSNQPPLIFNRELVKKHRTRAADGFEKYDFLFREMSERLCERLEYIKRDFPVALNLGARNGMVAEILAGRGGVKTLVQAEISEKMLRKAGGLRVVADEEFLPFAENSFDLVLSVGSLHLVNDLTGTLIQIQRVLKPDGLFLAVLFGGLTLKELRASFEKAEIEIRGGVSPRVSPFVDVRDGGSLLQRAGFYMPVADSEMLNVEYAHPLKLMRELRGMGEANTMFDAAKNFTPCSLMMQAVDNYLQDFSNKNGRIDASFELVTLTGWKG
jgi:SAM-dependent methyltransferase